MSNATVELLIGIGTFFFTTLANAFVLGMFLGGLRTEMRLTSDRLAKIEGVFTLVPRRGDDVGKILSLGMVRANCLVYSLGILAYRPRQAAVYPV